MEIGDPSITTTQAEEPSITTAQAAEPSITTTQAAEIEESSDSVSKTIKHQHSHQSIQNPLPPTKRHSKRLQALPKTQAGRVLQGFQSSYSLKNPTGQGLISQGGIPISAKDWTSKNGEQIQENEKPTDNVPVTQENPDEQPLFTDEEQPESETQVPTEEAPITSGSQQTLPAGLRFDKKTPLQKEAPQLNINHFLPRQSTSKSVSQTRSVNVGFHSGAVTSIELMEKRSFTAEEVSQALDNCMFIIRESLKICGRKNIKNEELDMVYKGLPSFIVDHCQSETLALILHPFAELPKWAYVDLGNVVEEVCEMIRVVDDNFRPSTIFKNIDPKSSSGFIVVYEELPTVLLQSSSLKTHYGPDGESVIGGAGTKKVTNSKYPNLEHKLTKNATESKIKFQQQCLYCLSNFFLLGPRAIFTANSQDHQKQARWHSLARLEVTKIIIEEELKKDEMGMHWAPFGNLRKHFLVFASLLTKEEIDWEFFFEKWQWFTNPHTMTLHLATNIELIVNTELSNETPITN
ncbi:hypothetical protein BY996DRAFT_8441209 [Phakopsora pachyrhizi]|nr:hypothetical protein BY996DRAFT_8441209 [Phakopsora pachyrhizi]